MPPPLKGIRVVDFTTLIPGPLASLILTQAGADIVKIESAPGGDDLRAYGPFSEDGRSMLFAALNAGKDSRFLDLKQPADRDAVLALVDSADILIEQFRPGVMARLGLDRETLRARNPRLIYCSITSDGQDGPRAQAAAHDINMLAEAGLLSLVADADGTPSLAPVPLADLAGGTYSALLNILLALRSRDHTGLGCHLDIAMAENVFTLMLRPLVAAMAAQPALPNGDLITGVSPRYAVYRTRDGRFIAVGALEDKFWTPLCAALGVTTGADRATIAQAFAVRDLDDWMDRLAETDVCCSAVRTVAEAMADPAFHARGLFTAKRTGEAGMSPLPLPLAPPVSRTVKRAKPSA